LTEFTEFHNNTTEGTAYALRAREKQVRAREKQDFIYFESFIQRVCT